MKALLTASGLVLLVVVALLATIAVAQANGAGTKTRTLVVDLGGVTFSTGASVDLEKGDPFYGDSEVFAEGTIETEPPIGKYIFNCVATEPIGTYGSLCGSLFTLFGRGVISCSGV